MNLPIPIVGVDSGLVWEQSLSSCLSIIDQHMHSPGFGVPINPSGININAPLSFNGQFATAVGGLFLTQNPAPFSSSNLTVLYSGNGLAGDLFFNDGSGNQIQITSGGNVNATASGIASGTASASFSANVLVVNAATNTPANIQVASILLGNNVANSKYLTLSPPPTMATNIGQTLPTIPADISFMQMDTSGNMSASVPIANGITRSNLAAVGQQVSSSCGNFSVPTSITPVTNLSVTITTSGRPVILMLQSDGTTSVANFQLVSGLSGCALRIEFLRNGTQIFPYACDIGASTTASFPGSIVTLDAPAAGTYTYSVSALIAAFSGASANIQFCELVAYEL